MTLSKLPISAIPFKQWLSQDKENKYLFWLSLIAITMSFAWIKFLYPYPNFMPPDSYNYLEAANNNVTISIWPIGYSKFLQIVGSISKSHIVLFIVQFLLLYTSLLYFLFTVRYLFAPGKLAYRIIFLISILNPLLPHISNFVSSDCLFITLSLIWFTQLLWIIFRPTKFLFILQAVILLIAFIVRYQALFYPFISIAIILFSNTRKHIKWMGIITTIGLLMIFIGYNQYEYNAKTKTNQFSAFSGWQLAANALYGYAHATLDSSYNVPENYKELHTLVNTHMKSIRHIPDFMRPDKEIGVYYLWDFQSPLVKYRENIWKHDSTAPYFTKWASVAPLYFGYGRYLIKKHPTSFIKYYLLPNLKYYYSPPMGFLWYYNRNMDSVEKIAVTWFKWKTNKIHTYYTDKEIKVSGAFNILIPIINTVFLLSLLAFGILGGFKTSANHRKRIIWAHLIVWLSNMLFSVFAAPIELRYEIFPLTITIVFTGITLGFITAKSQLKQQNKIILKESESSFA